MNLTDVLHLPLSTGVFYALPFLVALTVIVFIHELGHFLVARWCGVDVEAFSIGFGREIFGWYDRHGTRWKVAWIPLGGYVRFRGDANAASMPDAEALQRAKVPADALALNSSRQETKEGFAAGYRKLKQDKKK